MEVPQKYGVCLLFYPHSDGLFHGTSADLGDELHDFDGPGFLQVLTAFIEIDSMFVVQYENIAQTQSSCGLPVHELLFEYIQCQWGQVHGQEIDTVFVNDQK